MKTMQHGLWSLILLTISLHAQKEINPVEQATYNWSRTFAEVVNLANQKHFHVTEKVIERSMISGLNGYVESLDPHSAFLSPEVYQRMLQSMSGEFFGIGIVIDNTRKPKDKSLTIVDTIPDGPSDKEGILPMDKIVEIDGETLDGKATEEVIAKIKGERNSKVSVKIMREGHQDLLTFEIPRDIVKEQNSLSFYLKDQNIYYISLNVFSENGVRQIEKLLKKASSGTYRGLILDLRNNSGGLLTAVIDIAGLFVEKNSIVVTTKDKNGKVTDERRTLRNPITNKSLPIFVLINNYTASAAEILAGCLKIHASNINSQHSLVFLVGNTTFGKGNVQEVIPISNNCAMKLTTSLYYLPNDTTIQGTGIEPDFVIDRLMPPTEQMTWFMKNYGRENALENYIKPGGADKNEDKKEKKKEDKKEESKNKRWIERARDMLQKDNQLRATISLINSLDSAQKLCPGNVKDRSSAISYLKKQHITNDKLNIEEVKL